jgi:glutamate dehydrogenase/leucine dehydrogenase
MSTNCTTTRPGNGGLRVRSYASADAAEREATALCEAMTLKHAAYNTGFTGAKLVFDASVPIETINKEQLMCDVARTLAGEEGRVYTGCDINTTESDMDFLDNISPYVPPLALTEGPTGAKTRLA